jgi:hypothetical protein
MPMGMDTRALKHILRRIQMWPPAAQQEALQSLRAIEADFFDADLPPRGDRVQFDEPEDDFEIYRCFLPSAFPLFNSPTPR